VGVLFVLVGALLVPVVLLILFGLATIAHSGLHTGPGNIPDNTKLMILKDAASAIAASVLLIIVGIGLIQLKSWARTGAQVLCALFVAATLMVQVAVFGGYEMPALSMWITFPILVASAVFQILAVLALAFGILLQSRRAKDCFWKLGTESN
jgi:hypothetical protein